MSNRDTQFQGFAKLLFEELKPDLTFLFTVLRSGDKQGLEDHESIVQTIIARRTYDLACHVVESCMDQEATCQYDARHIDMDMVQHIPDLTEWPGREENEP